jgi:hypothetical protein
MRFSLFDEDLVSAPPFGSAGARNSVDLLLMPCVRGAGTVKDYRLKVFADVIANTFFTDVIAEGVIGVGNIASGAGVCRREPATRGAESQKTPADRPNNANTARPISANFMMLLAFGG